MEPQVQNRTDSVQTYSGLSEKNAASPGRESTSSLHEPFRNLDDAAVLEESMQAVSAPTSRNFILEFSDAHAHVALDLEPGYIQSLLKSDRQEPSSTRWINLWYPSHQRNVLELLGRHYDFSPRLLALMCADPRRSVRSSDSSAYAMAAAQERSLSDLESGSPNSRSRQQSPDLPSLASNNPARTGNLYDIVDEVWHYTSIDQGRSYLCLGYNSLYSVGHIAVSPGINSHDSNDSDTPIPNVQRIWTWLLLLSDRTVITITEDPFPYTRYLLPHQHRILQLTRQNLLNVFRSLSNLPIPILHDNSPLTLLPIRRRLGATPEETVHRTTDAPGLLFYYVFENWENSYALVTRRESRYGRELERLRAQMFKCPKLSHVDKLDHVGRELSVLKRHYGALLRLIDRVIAPQKASLASLANSRVVSKASGQSLSGGYVVDARTGVQDSRGGDGDVEGVAVVVEADSLLGVGISSAARVRFERLRDMIALYALSECEDYLHQKEELVQMVSWPDL